MSQHDPPPPTGASDTQGDADEAYCAACNQSFALDHEFCPNDGAKLVKLQARPDMLLGRVFDGRYEVRGSLGHGGMGTVYRGWQRSVDREVAIKVIHPKLASERSVAKRFLREARLSSRLSQPNIINVYDFGQSDDGILYLVMELLRGNTLSKELESQRPMALRRIATVAKQMCDALDAAHSQGIIHRDLKPGNIMLLDDPPGRDLIKVLDFGLAKSLVAETTSLVTQTDALLGTPLYMPPEQILGKPSDQRADLYSLGCILYQMAVGRPPFIGENINATLAAHVQNIAPPLPLHVPPSLSATITKLMMKEPGDRFTSAREVHDALSAIPVHASANPEIIGGSTNVSVPSDLSIQAMQPPRTYTSEPEARAAVSTMDSVMQPPRRRWLLPILALFVLAAVTTAIVLVATNKRGATTGADAGTSAVGVDSLATTPDTDLAGATPTGSLDAPVAVDAGVADAGRRATPDARVPARRVDAGVVRPPITRDAAVSRPPVIIDAAPRPIDAAKPDIDYIEIKRDAGAKSGR